MGFSCRKTGITNLCAKNRSMAASTVKKHQEEIIILKKER